MEGADQAKRNDLCTEPFSWAELVEQHIGWDFQEDDAGGQQLLADVELILRDADILELEATEISAGSHERTHSAKGTHKVVREGIGDVASVKL